MNRVTDLVLGTSWWVSLAVLVAILLLIAELGFRVARKALSESTAKRAPDQIAVILGAILGLLGLLLAFSFAMAEARYSARRSLVLDEANAIGTTYLRAKLLPQPPSARVQELLREYIHVRLSAHDPAALDRAIHRSGQIHALLWREAKEVGQANPESEVVGLFISSLNEVIDLHTSRLTVGLYQRIPRPIFGILLIVSSLAAIILGYASGISNWRAPIPTIAVIVAISFAIVMIVQIDLPGAPLFDVSQFAIEDLKRTVEGSR